MGVWKLWSRDIEFGWTSPVDGPVHPSLVPVMSADGLGWLEGFDELVVRCGLESNGAPEFAENGTLRYPLHGRIANLPANHLTVTVNPNDGSVDVSGETIESKLFFHRLRLKSTIRFKAGSSQVHLIDRVTNDRPVDATMQLLYHINIGSPVLDSGATVGVNAESGPSQRRSLGGRTGSMEPDGTTANRLCRAGLLLETTQRQRTTGHTHCLPIRSASWDWVSASAPRRCRTSSSGRTQQPKKMVTS